MSYWDCELIAMILFLRAMNWFDTNRFDFWTERCPAQMSRFRGLSHDTRTVGSTVSEYSRPGSNQQVP